MASYSNFSKKNREFKDIGALNSIQNVESNKINEKMINDFQGNKEKWRELCSYFRLI